VSSVAATSNTRSSVIETGKQWKITSSIDTSDYSGRSARSGPPEEPAAPRRAFLGLLAAECPGKPRPEAHIMILKTCVVGHDLRHELIDDEKRLLGMVGKVVNVTCTPC
jgi:hypothetical protein